MILKETLRDFTFPPVANAGKASAIARGGCYLETLLVFSLSDIIFDNLVAAWILTYE